MSAKTNWKRWCFFIPLLMVPASLAFAADVSPETVKAMYMLNMQKYITVGNPPHAPKKFCYYERQAVPLAESAGQQIEKYVNTHPSDAKLSVKKFDAIRDLSGCDIFYIPTAEESNIDAILAAIGTSSTLTVSGADRFTLRGGMIGFVEDDNNKIRMDANQKNAEDKKVHIDASLLEIMLHVTHQ